MSREFKFRVWNRQNGGYVAVSHIQGHPLFSLDLHFRLNWLDDCWDGQTHAGYIFEQWTGLKDKNGQEIYEGDIMPYQWWADWQDRRDNPNGTWLNTVVAYNPMHAAFQLYTSIKNISLSHGVHITNGKEVIGNLRQNPELLSQ